MGTREWQEVNTPDSLLVQVQLDKVETAEELGRVLSNLDADVHWDETACLFSVVSENDENSFILRLKDLLDSYNYERGTGERAEIIETRLVQNALRSTVNRQNFHDFSMEVQPGTKNDGDSIYLESGRSFGTGTHPSTRLVIDFLKHHIAQPFPTKVLDVGCGSGILSLVSARLGAQEVVGVDICPHSVAVARGNVIKNNLCSKITITDTVLQEIKGEFDLILANLTPSVLHRLIDDIKRLGSDGGRLIVSGLQGRQADESADVFLMQGWREEQRLSEGKWQALFFMR